VAYKKKKSKAGKKKKKGSALHRFNMKRARAAKNKPGHSKKRLSKAQRRRSATRLRRSRDPWNPKELTGQAAADAQLAWARSKGNHSVSAIKVVDGQWYRKYGKNKHWDNGLSDSGFEYRNGKMYSVATGEMDSPSNYSYEYID